MGDNAPTYEDKMLKASAWYEVTYKSAVSNIKHVSFVWEVCDDWMNRIKCDYGNGGKRLSFTLSGGNFSNVFIK
jgi:hypothetical protein